MGLRCGYHGAVAPTPVNSSVHDLDLPLAAAPSPTRPLHHFTVPASIPVAVETDLHLLVQHSIRALGLFVDDISSRYFDGIHRYIPVISRPRFQHDLIGPGSAPSAGFSVLLLAMCLVHSSPALGRSGQAASQNFPARRVCFAPSYGHGPVCAGSGTVSSISLSAAGRLVTSTL
jgi:hypothetical protein